MTSPGAGIVDAAGTAPGTPGAGAGIGWSAGGGPPGAVTTGGAVTVGGAVAVGTGMLGTTTVPAGPLGMAILLVLVGVGGRTEREGSVGSVTVGLVGVVWATSGAVWTTTGVAAWVFPARVLRSACR